MLHAYVADDVMGVYVTDDVMGVYMTYDVMGVYVADDVMGVYVTADVMGANVTDAITGVYVTDDAMGVYVTDDVMGAYVTYLDAGDLFGVEELVADVGAVVRERHDMRMLQAARRTQYLLHVGSGLQSLYWTQVRRERPETNG